MKAKNLAFLIVILSIGFASCRNPAPKTAPVVEMPTDSITYIRSYALEGAYNLRGLGGFLTTNGKHVKDGTVFRSDEWSKLTENDLKFLETLQIKTIIDFRGVAEAQAAPDKKPSTCIREIAIPIHPGGDLDFQNLTSDEATKLMVEMNKRMVRENQADFARFFEILMDTANLPVDFHCTAGKDRTGLAAALFLSALGVDRLTIMQDYLLSARNAETKYAALLREHPNVLPLMTVKPEYLQAALDVIDKEYGGMDRYLTRNLHVDLEKIRTLYTQ